MKTSPFNDPSGWRRQWKKLSQTARFVSGGLPAALLFRLGLRLPALWYLRFRCDLGGHPFWVRPVDDIAFEEILFDGEYDFAAQILADEPSAAPTVIDGGANVGLFSLAMLIARPDATVHALEPDARTFQILKRNAAANPKLRWHAHPLALWKSAGPLKFGATPSSAGSRVHELAPKGRVETAEGITLAGFLAQHSLAEIALLKLDIEGAEEAVLRENEGVLDRARHLILEIHPGLSDENWIMRTVERHFPFVHQISGRTSAKPVILASRTIKDLPNGSSQIISSAPPASSQRSAAFIPALGTVADP